jgi:hypothetical protein
MPEETVNAAYVKGEVDSLARELFRVPVETSMLEAVMALRGLDPQFVRRVVAEPAGWPGLLPLREGWHAELRAVVEAFEKEPALVKMLWKWLGCPELWERSESLMSDKANYLEAETYVRLQQALMGEVAKRKVAIETLPSSNVRIGPYATYLEHHALRWMGISGFKVEGDPEIVVCLGSDDPGIFAGDLSGEFYHLHCVLRQQNIGDRAALDALAALNERGRQYGFHDPSFV